MEIKNKVKNIIRFTRLPRLLLVLSALWFSYWIAYEVVVWHKTFPTNIGNVFGFVLTVFFFVVLSSSRLLQRVTRLSIGKQHIEKDGEIPASWLKKTAKPSTSREIHSRFKPTKIHIPLLRTGKRVVAGLLLIVNIVISQATLMSHSDTQPLFWLFILNSFIILDYLWKTRRSEG